MKRRTGATSDRVAVVVAILAIAVGVALVAAVAALGLGALVWACQLVWEAVL